MADVVAPNPLPFQRIPFPLLLPPKKKKKKKKKGGGGGGEKKEEINPPKVACGCLCGVVV